MMMSIALTRPRSPMLPYMPDTTYATDCPRVIKMASTSLDKVDQIAKGMEHVNASHGVLQEGLENAFADLCSSNVSIRGELSTIKNHETQLSETVATLGHEDQNKTHQLLKRV